MKGGSDGEKLIGPLFPRLHINDSEKGGPKAPPRNKMALYEQFSIPTQRFTSGSSNASPLPHKDARNLVPSTSSIHHKKSAYSVLGNVPAPHLAERLHSHSSVGAIMNTSSMNRAGKLKTTSERDSGNLSIAAHYSYFRPHNSSNSRNNSTKRLRDKDDCRVPAFVQLEKETPHSVGDIQKKDDFDSVRMRHLKSTSDLFSKHCTSIKENIRNPLSCEGTEKIPSTKEVELLEKRNWLADDSNKLHKKNEVLQKTKVLEKGTKGDSENVLENSNTCTLEAESYFKPSLRNDDQSRSNECGALQLVEVKKDEEITETCNVDSISVVRISADAVVEAIGQEQFWKTRSAIVHQQKVFSVQVFELHRLIKVQRLFAESPDILTENNFFPGKPSIDESPSKKLRLENAPEPPPIITPPQPKDVPQISNLISNTSKGLNNLLSNCKPYLDTDPKPSPWCFPTPPPGNQWLVPVMSPSEGLIYKPYTGPCPPTTALPGPVLSGPMSPTAPIGDDYLRFGFFPPYCIPSLGPLGKARSKLNDQMPYPSSFSSYYMKNLVETKESEIHGSTASSPDIRLRENNALPLFPTAPTTQALDKSDKTQSSMNRTRVIKVVPHNARSASESAARIFRSIQEERRQHG